MKVIPLIILAGLTLWPLIHVLYLKKVSGNLRTRIICFILFTLLSVGFYGTGALHVVMHYLDISRLDNNYQPLGAGPSIGFAWFLVLIGLVCLRQWFGVIFNRAGTVWYSDD